MKNFSKKKIFITLVMISVIISAVFVGVDYYQWTGVKKAVALGGYSNIFGGKFGAIIPQCVMTSGSCTCPFCNECGCVGYAQAIIGVPQAVNGPVVNLCVSNTLPVKGTPIAGASGMDFIGGSFTGKCMAGTATLGTASYAVNKIDKVKNFFNDFIIASFK